MSKNSRKNINVSHSATEAAMNFFHFFTKGKSQSEPEQGEMKTRFIEARTIISSNPFHKEPIQKVESVEDVLAIKNCHEIRDQILWVPFWLSNNFLIR